MKRDYRHSPFYLSCDAGLAISVSTFCLYRFFHYILTDDAGEGFSHIVIHKFVSSGNILGLTLSLACRWWCIIRWYFKGWWSDRTPRLKDEKDKTRIVIDLKEVELKLEKDVGKDKNWADNANSLPPPPPFPQIKYDELTPFICIHVYLKDLPQTWRVCIRYTDEGFAAQSFNQSRSLGICSVCICISICGPM